ncbi:MAG: hypothetical protein ACREWI_18335, partial [Telluria sp.]
MKQFSTFASDLSLNALLACSAAVLLSACGGSTIDPVGAQHSATAAQVTSDVGSLASVEAAAPAVEADAAAAATPAAQASTATPAAGVTTADFELSGYASNPLAPTADQS